MSQHIDGNNKSFVAGGAISQYARVKLSSGKLAAAGLTDKELGVALEAAFADGDRISVKLRSGAGTHPMIAAGPVTAGAAVNTAASGKCDDAATATGFLIGTALEAATADGDIIEVLYNAHGDTAIP